MFPVRDRSRTRRFPFLTYLIILVNVFVFVRQVLSPTPVGFIRDFALIPSAINWTNPLTLYPFVTSQFLHAGMFHIFSNMWFLKIFGNNVEDRLGGIRFMFVYLAAGVAGGLAQYAFFPDSDIPMLGASGAVAGILGAYLVLFPYHKIETVVLPFLFLVHIPASVMLAYWFFIQLFSGLGGILTAQPGGVAWWAHVGGFGVGWIIARLSSIYSVRRINSY